MSDEQESSVFELFQEIQVAKARMSLNNPHRQTFIKCEAALWSLSKELHDLKHAKEPVMVYDAEAAPV